MAKEQEYGLLLEQGCTMREAALLATISKVTGEPLIWVSNVFAKELTKAKEFEEWENSRKGATNG